MKRALPFLLASVALAPILLGQTPCPDQPFRDILTCPYPIDPAQIAIDPNTGQRCCLDWIVVRTKTVWNWTGAMCDDDGNPMTVSAIGVALKDNLNGTYTLSGVAGNPNTIAYITVTLVDQPTPVDIPATEAPVTRKGTVVVIAVPKNRPPRLGARVTVAYDPDKAVWPMSQQKVVMEQYKLTGYSYTYPPYRELPPRW